MAVPTSPDAQAEIDRLINYVNEQIELLALEQPDPVLLKKIVQGLADPRRSARIGLIDALSQIGEPAVPFLLGGLANHADPVVRRACCHALANTDEEASVAGLVEALLNDVDIGVKSAAAGALAKVGAPAFEAIRTVLASSTASESCKGHAAWAMASISGEIRSGEISEQLYQMMADPSPAVRTAAVGAIAQLAQAQLAQAQRTQNQLGQTQPNQTPADSSIPFSLLSSPVPGELPAAVQRTLSRLTLALKDCDSDVRIEAAAHLARLNYQAAYQPLVTCLKDSNREVRKAAVLALGKLGNIKAIAAIAPLSKDPEPAVRSMATLVIRRLKSSNSPDLDLTD